MSKYSIRIHLDLDISKITAVFPDGLEDSVVLEEIKRKFIANDNNLAMDVIDSLYATLKKHPEMFTKEMFLGRVLD